MIVLYLVMLPACGLTIQHGRHRSELAALWAADPRHDVDTPIEDVEIGHNGRLDRAGLIRAVLARNPNIAAARHGWRAALAGYRQETALEDPMVEYSFAPVSIGSRHAKFGQTVTLSQQFVGPGKLGLRRAIVLAEAKAAQHDFEAVRLELALMASLLFDRYYAVARSIAINDEYELYLQGIRSAAVVQYEAGRGSQRDPLRAELELTNVQRRGVQLRTERAIVQAEINGLLHQPPAHPLPPPPVSLEARVRAAEASVTASARSDSLAALEQGALARRPDMLAKRAEIARRDSALVLANRSYVPDFGVMGSYSTMWDKLPHRFMVGVSLNLPLQIRARTAAIQQAKAEHQRADAELSALRDTIVVEVEQAHQRLVEAVEIVRIYEARTLPVARAQVEATSTAYETGTGSFEDLIESQQALRTAQLESEMARAELSQRYAELEQSLGRMPAAYAAKNGSVSDDLAEGAEP